MFSRERKILEGIIEIASAPINEFETEEARLRLIKGLAVAALRGTNV